MLDTKQILIISMIVCGLNFSGLAQSYILVKNHDNPVEKLRKDEVMKIILVDIKEWPSDDLVQLVLYKKGAPQMKWLAKEVFGVSESVLLSKIAHEVFSGELRKPIISESDDDTLNKIKIHRGGVGIVSIQTAKQLPQGVSIIEFISF